MLYLGLGWAGFKQPCNNRSTGLEVVHGAIHPLDLGLARLRIDQISDSTAPNFIDYNANMGSADHLNICPHHRPAGGPRFCVP